MKIRMSFVLAGLYCLVALFLLWGGLFTNNDGGPWILLNLSYWPASEIEHWLEGMLEQHVAANTLREMPSASMSWLTIVDIAAALVLGTAWYCLLGHLVDVVLRRLSQKRT
jgi:hypothetical protein